MSAYDGHAVVTSGNETETAVMANLAHYRSGLRTGWGGTLTPTANDLQQVLNLTKGTLHLPNGRKHNFSDWTPPTGWPTSN